MSNAARVRSQLKTDDAFFDTQREAIREAQDRMGSAACEGLMTRIQSSPYGGYVVRSIPADFYVELAAEGSFPLLNGILGSRLSSLSDE